MRSIPALVTPVFAYPCGGKVPFVTRLVLLHGSVTNAALSWRKQQSLAADPALAQPERPARPGSPPGPPVERVDFEPELPWLESLVQPGDHLVGHSYGGVVALL